jgi:hypothetical protein
MTLRKIKKIRNAESNKKGARIYRLVRAMRVRACVRVLRLVTYDDLSSRSILQ